MKMNSRYRKHAKRNIVMKRVVSIMLTLSILLGYVPFPILSDLFGLVDRKIKVMAAGTGENKVFTDIATYRDYVTEYNSNPSSHKNDILTFAFSGSSTNQEFECDAIGLTEAAAFDGKIIIGTGIKFNLTNSMFKYITDDVEIVDTNGNPTTVVISRPRPGDYGPLFAENVVQSRDSGDPVEWKFEYSPYVTGNQKYTFDAAGFIGTLKENAKVVISDISFNNSGIGADGSLTANIVANSNGDAGFVCCTMESGSQLEIDSIRSTLETSIDKSFSITASSGHAGGLVGSMSSGAVLKIANTLTNIQASDATITANSGYAGGIVGKCDGGLIQIVQFEQSQEANSGNRSLPVEPESADEPKDEDDSGEPQDNGAKSAPEDDKMPSDTKKSDENVNPDKEDSEKGKTNEEKTEEDKEVKEPENNDSKVPTEDESKTVDDSDSNPNDQQSENDVVDNNENENTSDDNDTEPSKDDTEVPAEPSSNEENVENSDIPNEDEQEANQEDQNTNNDSDESTDAVVDNNDEDTANNEINSDEGQPTDNTDQDDSSNPNELDSDIVEPKDDGSDNTLTDNIPFKGASRRALRQTTTLDGSTAYIVSQVIRGSLGAGGIAGYYKASLANSSANTSVKTGLVNLASGNFKVNGTGACGGLFGEVYTDGTDMTITVNANVKPYHSEGAAGNYGGLIGKYTTSAQTLSLIISGTSSIMPYISGGSAKYYGGVIGTVDKNGNVNAYVNIAGVTVNAHNSVADNFFGGVIGRADEAFIKLNNTNTISYSGLATDKKFAGVVGSLANGVLYLCDNTDLSGAQTFASPKDDSGQIVGYRDCGFVFAAPGWKLYRCTVGQKVDDIGSWGEVVRFNTSNFIMANVITINETNHCVTIKKRSDFKNIANVTDYAIMSLNIQLNKSGNSSAGILRFEGGAGWKSSTILSSDMSIKASSPIDLRGTGLLGLTRDNGDADSTDFLEFKTKNINGNNSTIIMAIGEEYGESLSSSYGNGTIYRHKYNGLFAKMSGSSINGVQTYSNLTFGSQSVINVEACVSGVNVGTAVAYTSGTVSIYDVESDVVINCSGSSENYYIGGIVGRADGTIALNKQSGKQGCSFKGTVTSTNSSATVGGLIGGITANTFDSSIKNASVSGSITATGTRNDQKIGGLIASITESNSASTSRTLTLEKNEINNLTVDGSATNSSGGLFGYSWYKTDVVFGDGTNCGVEIKGTSKMKTNAPNGAALIYSATGYWKVNTNGIKITAATVDASSATSFGIMINKGTHGTSSAIYLELAREGFVISSGALDTTALNPSVSVFDELVAYSKVDGTDICDNGQGIVSINTYDGTNNSSKKLKMGNDDTTNTGATFQSLSGFEPTNGYFNPNTRYYYNLDQYRTSSNGNEEKFLIWSVNRYAHSSIRGYFTNTSFDESGLDLRGYSYYPIDLTSDVTISGNVHLYNSEFNATEGATTCKRASLAVSPSVTQHYTMQNSLFRNVTAKLTLNDLSLEGNVSIIGESADAAEYCGALVMGTVGGSSSAKPATIKINGLTLNGIKINGIGAGNTDYAPLLVNKAGSNATFDVSNVSVGIVNNSSVYADSAIIASSLIGNVGASTATSVKVSFSGMQLDGRNETGKNADGLDSVYKTSRSLFSRAVFLNSLAYSDNASYGNYYFRHDEDWSSDDSTATHTGNVTYGAEIVATVENRDANNLSKQTTYNESSIYTHPTNSNASSQYDDFGTKYQKYVYTGYNSNVKTHELRVNIAAQKFSGCGTYNDPYIIASGENLNTIAKIINGTWDGSFTITLPEAVTNSDQAVSWCNGEHYIYETFTRVGDDTNRTSSLWKTADNHSLQDKAMAKYLAGAYYQLPNGITITLDSNYVGLSNEVSSNDYVFHGVIDGNGSTIVNQSKLPLIVSSSGSVVRDLTITVDSSASQSLTTISSKAFSIGNDSCESYGAVIGKVFGGDNIIDNVSVGFEGTLFTKNNSNYAKLVPIGGYVGVVVDGGLIFKNMGTASHDGITNAQLSGFGTAPLTDDEYLYINPIIGRVINGYAVYEGSAYHWSEITGERNDNDGVTLKNGTKNYSITDIDPTLDKLNPTTVDGRNTIKFPNAQSMFILSVMTQSGITCGSYSGARHYADYDQIGSAASQSGDYADVATSEPYIVRKYTEVTTPTATPVVTPVVTPVPVKIDTLTKSGIWDFSLGGDDAEWYMPDGFRGIGAIGFKLNDSNINNRTFSLRRFVGKNDYGTGSEVEINLNISVKHYEDGADNYLTGSSSNGGLGLFNKFRQNNVGTATDDDKISDLKLSGLVEYDVARLNVENNFKYSSTYVQKSTYLHVGGLAGCIGTGDETDKIRISAVGIDGLEVNGYESAGGFFGYLNLANNTNGEVKISDVSSTTTFKVTAKRYAGGLIGYFGRGNLDVSDVIISSPEVLTHYRGKDRVDFENGAGGVVGFAKNGSGNIPITFNRVTLGALRSEAADSDNFAIDSRIGYYDSTVFVQTNPGAQNNAHDDTIAAGGLIGRCDTSGFNNGTYSLQISNCNVYNVSIYGHKVGGILGSDTDKNSKILIQNCKIVSDTTERKWINGYTIDSKDRGCGGITGGNRNKGLVVENCQVSGYGIKGRNDTGGVCAWADSGEIHIKNFKLDDVIFQSDYCGGLVGYQNVQIKGYNILVDGVQFKTSNNETSLNGNVGYIVGKNFKAYKTEIIGFTRIHTDGYNLPDRMTGTGSQASKGSGSSSTSTTSSYGNGYVVFADYKGNTGGATYSNVAASTNFSGNASNPYVLTSPFVRISKAGISTTQILTGDGVSATSYGLSAAKDILDDMNGGTSTKRYQQTGLDATAQSGLKNLLTNKMSSFSFELTKSNLNEYTGSDFPVLIIDDATTVDSTIKNYIKLLTNCSYSFKEGDSSVPYTIDISKYKYNSDSGLFVKQSGEASLKFDTGRGIYYILTTEQDNTDYQFSLVDVKFKDPTNNGQCAYHLYIPVMVEKMLHYDVTIRPASGTTYQLDAYPNSETNLVENLGNPITLKVGFTYQQSSSDWAKAINSGENVQRNYDKSLMLTVTHASGTGIPLDSKMILVDPNCNKDLMYSADFSTGNTNLLSQRAVGTGSTTYDLNFSGFAGFDECKLNDLMKISIDTTAAASDKKLVACGANDTPTVIINDGSGNDGLRLRAANNNETGAYAVKVTGWNDQAFGTLTEDYYISIFEPANENDSIIYHYEFDADDSFRVTSYPSARINEEASHVLIGNLYNNSVTINEVNTNSLISKSNNYLEADLTAQVGFNRNAMENLITNYIKGNDNIEIYQTFLVSLQKIQDSVTSMGIVLTPECTFDYAVNGVPITETEKKECKDLGIYMELPTEHGIKTALCNAAGNFTGTNEDDCKITITARVRMSYSKYELDVLSDQFPISDGSDGNGTKMVGYSNLSSDSNNGSSSRASANTISTLPSRRLYYMDDIKPVTLNYMVDDNVAFENDGNANYGQLGINAHPDADEVASGMSQICTLASFDASSYSFRKNAEYLKIELSLKSKADNYTVELPITNYLYGLQLLDKNGDPVNNTTSGNTYIYIVPISDVKRDGDDSYSFEIPIDFEVYTGTGQSFEGSNRQYSNYRVEIKVSMLDTNQDFLRGSEDNDWIVYTNARIYRDVLPNPLPNSGG